MSADGRQVETVGVVGSDTDVLSTALSEAGLQSVTGSVETIIGDRPDAIAAVGEPALSAVARERPDSPLVPVAAGRGVRSVPTDSISAAVASLAAGNWTTESHSLLDVRPNADASARALFDVTVVTERPAHISEFSVVVGGETVARFRADGVVAATPAGTSGYARAAGAPVIPPGPDVIAIVAIAPFATNLDHWVLPIDDVTIAVERDEATLETFADDRKVGYASLDDPVRVTVDTHVDVVRLPESVSPFGGPQKNL